MYCPQVGNIVEGLAWGAGFPYIRLCQSRKVEFVGVVSCPLGVMLDEHHHVYRQIDDVAYCFHIALAESEGAGNGIFRV